MLHLQGFFKECRYFPTKSLTPKALGFLLESLEQTLRFTRVEPHISFLIKVFETASKTVTTITRHCAETSPAIQHKATSIEPHRANGSRTSLACRVRHRTLGGHAYVARPGARVRELTCGRPGRAGSVALSSGKGVVVGRPRRDGRVAYLSICKQSALLGNGGRKFVSGRQ